MSDKHWKAEERRVGEMLGGARYPANQGGRVDVESLRIVAQVKHRRVCSLAELERLALEMAALGRARGKLGIVVVKRRAGAGRPTPRLVVCVEDVWRGSVAPHSPDPTGDSRSRPVACPSLRRGARNGPTRPQIPQSGAPARPRPASTPRLDDHREAA